MLGTRTLPENIQKLIVSPSTLNLRLVGQHSLWAHHLWNASKVLADYFDLHPDLVKEKRVLELGAGGALPSFTAACNGAERVLILCGFH